MSDNVAPKEIKILLAVEPMLHAWSGASAGAISCLLLYPIENIKTRVQIQHKKQQNSLDEQNKKQVTYTSIISEIYNNEGICGFYKGLSALLTGNFISYGIYFYFYELIKKVFKINPGNFKGFTLASMLAGTATSLGTNPFWVINTRMTFQKDNKNFFETLFEMVKKEGFGSLYKGQSASLFLVINPIIQFTLYEYLKQLIKKDQKFQFLLFFLAGALSKVVATIFTYPPQLLRTHQHMNQSKEKLNYIQLIQKLFKEEGFFSLYKGVEAKMLQSVLNSAFMLAFYETVFKIVKYMYIALVLKKNPKGI